LLPLEEDGCRIFKDGVLAIKSRLGWTLGGQLDTLVHQDFCYTVLPEVHHQQDVQAQVLAELRRFNDLEAIGIEPAKTRLSRGEVEDQMELDKTTFWKDGRVTTRMLWKGEFISVPPSEVTARKRLTWLQGKLKKMGMFEKYAKTISSDLEKGYIRKLSPEESKELRQGIHWFLPHFVVCHPDKPDRPRRVLDCAAKTDGVCLNSFLRTGPNNLSNLAGVIHRSRAHEFIIEADITEMFSQVKVYPEDQKMLAFLWTDDPEQEPDVYVNTRHVFGAKCSPAVANNAVKFALQRAKPEIASTVSRKFYMDDFFHGANRRQKALKEAMEVKEGLGESSFVLTKWASNDPWILKQFKPEDLAPLFREFQDKDGCQLPTLKALGLRWDAELDRLGYSTRLKPEPPKNLAQVLSQLASVYDLLQIIGPFIMRGKLLLQKFSLSGKTWTDMLEEDQVNEWVEWTSQLPQVARLFIPRWYGSEPGEPLVLHMFSDASDKGYGAVGVLSSLSGTRSFVAAKGRVINPNKPPTTPRAELQALVVGARLADAILEELAGYLNIQRVVFWVDSIVVYYWMQNKATRYKEFVANRINEVLEIFTKRKELSPEVHWLDTNSNPADLISKGCDSDVMEERFEFWTQGPDFIVADEATWPAPPSVPEKEEEVKLKEVFALVLLGESEFAEVDDLKSYVRSQLEVEEPTPDQLQEAENKIIEQIQAESFAEEIRALKKSGLPQPEEGGEVKSMVFSKGSLKGLQVFLDAAERLRLVTRFVEADFLSWGERCPLVLSTKHAATRLLVREYHRRNHHAGSRTTFAELSKKFYVSQACVKSEVFRCQDCRRHFPLQASAPQASIHRFRLAAWTYVFENTGMDYFGPFLIKNKKKVWGLLLTCLTTRAVHIELCPDMTVPSWLNAIDRFVSRRGKPGLISCDNAGTFVSGGKQHNRIVREQLSQEFRDAITQAVVDKFSIKFHFIPPQTPHYGGPWERMVREVRRCLVKSTSTVANLSYDALMTYLIRAESIINRRPLAIGEDLRVITPMSVLAPASEAACGFASTCSMSRVLGQLRQAIDHFWRTWTSLYLRSLSANRYPQGHPGYVELSQGDQVFFKKNSAFHRLPGSTMMEAGVVRRAYLSKDGISRRFDIEDKEGKIFEVPVSRVFLSEQAVVDRRGPALGAVPI
jgi:hypothetical protein